MSFICCISRIAVVSALLGAVLCGCKTRTITYTRKEDPLLEKYASNYSIKEGRASSDKRSMFESKQFSGKRGYQAGEFRSGEYPRSEYAGATEFLGRSEYSGATDREVTLPSSSMQKKRFIFGRKKPRESNQKFRSEEFAVSAFPGGEKSAPTPEDPFAAGARQNDVAPEILLDRSGELTVEEVRTLLNRN